jgi:hypothetical protein
MLSDETKKTTDMVETFVFHEYRLTEDVNLHKERYNLTPYHSDLLESAALESMASKKKKTGERLAKLVKQYPHIPMFKNYLMVFYHGINDRVKADELIEIIHREHPDYLFGKVALAHKSMDDGHAEKVTQILGETLELKDLYPEREIFHEGELKGFLMAVIRYYSVTGQIDLANQRLELMIELAPNDLITKHAETMATTASFAGKMEERRRLMEKFSRSNGKPVPPSSKTEPPKFNHDEIHHLYEYDMGISPEIIQEILQLPRETLIPDLETLLRDAVERYDFFYETIEEDYENNFLLHALLLLAELKAEESLPKVLQFLSYDSDFLDFWLGDHITETVWRCIYPLGFNQTEALKQFILEPDNYTFTKTAVSEALRQLVFHQPERRGEVIDLFSEVFTIFGQRPAKYIDLYLINSMIDDAKRSGLSELLPEIKVLNEREYFDPREVGDYNDIAEAFNEPIDPDNIYALLSIFELYEMINSSWLRNGGEYDDADEDFNEFEDFDDLSDDDEADWDKSILRGLSRPAPISAPKVGRNDPCPCGSGKKYKKCCMEKDAD